MENKLFKILILFFILSNIFSCGCLKKKIDTETSGTLIGYEKVINNWQLDSKCTVDELNPYIEDWASSTFFDYETNEKIVEKLYIKELENKREIIYRLIQKDTLYLITKRIGITE